MFLSVILAAAIGQCPGGVCPAPSRVAQAAENECPLYEWRQHNEEQHILYKDGHPVGQWFAPHRTFYPWDGTANGPAAKPPINPPTRKATSSLKEWANHGVDNARVHGIELESFNHSGEQVGPGRFQAALNGEIADESKKGYFTIIAKEKKSRDAVLAAWSQLPQDFQDRYNVWCQEPNHFSMLDRDTGKPRFVTEGDTSVVLQRAGGGVLFRRPQAGALFAIADVRELLKFDPDYKPALDPGAPVPATKFSLPNVPPAGIAVGVLALAALLLKLKRK